MNIAKRKYKSPNCAYRILPTLLILAVVVVSTIFTSGCGNKTVDKVLEQKPYESGTPITGTMQSIAKNSKYELYVNPENGEFEVRSTDGQKTWLSNPVGKETDTVAKDIWKTNMSSQMILDYTNKKVTTNAQANTFAGSVKSNGLKIYPCENGYIAVYYFTTEKISIPMQVVLTADGFDAVVLMDKITGDGNPFYLTGIQLLPFLGAANKDDKGYMLVPDGSGALINLNNGKYAAGSYMGQIYGADASFKPTTSFANQKNSMLPVYGMKTGENALFAIITQGEALGTINANVSGGRTTYNFIYTSFQLRAKDSFFIADRSGKNRENIIMDKSPISLKKLSIKYYLLEKDKANYSGMAEKYTEYLTKEKGLKSKNIITGGVYIDIYCGVLKTEPKLGFPVKSTKVLTSYKQATEMINHFKTLGIDNFVVRLRNASDSDINKKPVSKFNLNSKLGTKSEYQKLLDIVGKDRVYISVDPINVQSNGWVVKTLNTTTQTVMGIPAYQLQYDLATGFKKSSDRWYLLSPLIATSYFEKYVTSALKSDFSKYIALEEVPTKLYSDYSKNWADVESNKNYWTESLKKAYDAGASMLMDGGNAYSIPYAQRLTGIPSSSSGFVIIDSDVPFVQLALNGMIEYATEPVNLSSNPKRAFLKAIESDSCLSYTFIYQDPVVLRNTELSWIYGADYRVWEAEVSQNNKRYNEFKKVTNNSTISLHQQIESGVVKVSYANGGFVIVNYTDKPVMVDNITVPSMDFVALGKAG